MPSRLEPMCTTLIIDYRSDVWAACKCVGALLRCVLIRTGTRTGPATAALTAGAMKPLSGRAAAAAAAQLDRFTPRNTMAQKWHKWHK